MVISIGRSWYVYSGMWNMWMGGIADMYRKRFRDAESQGLRGGDGWGGRRV
jgi:hypothetical protein